MSEAEIVKFALQAGMGGVFFYLYWITNKRLQDQQDQHDRDIAALYGQRINDLKFIAKLPTDLEGDYKMGPDSRVKA